MLPIENTVNSGEGAGILWTVHEGMRCMCQWRISYSVHCEDELLKDITIFSEKCHFCWYNDQYGDQGCNTIVCIDDSIINEKKPPRNSNNLLEDCYWDHFESNLAAPTQTVSNCLANMLEDAPDDMNGESTTPGAKHVLKATKSLLTLTRIRQIYSTA